MKRILCVFLIICVLSRFGVYSQSITDYGLKFRSHEVNKDLRTSFEVNPIPPIEGGFVMTFSMHLMENREKFGYIFRLVVNNERTIDLISNSHSTSGHNIALIEGNKPTVIAFDLARNTSPKKDGWVDITVNFDTPKGRVAVSVGDKTISDTLVFEQFNSLRLFFGGNEDGKFSSSDVPPIKIRDLRIFDNKKTLLRHWEFKQHMGDMVYDLVKKQPLKIKNPVWLIDDHTHWTKRTAFLTNLRPQIAFRPDSATVMMATSDSLFSYSLVTHVWTKKKYANGTIFPVQNNQITYNPYTKQLWQYDLRKNQMARYNIPDNSWNNEDRVSKEPKFWHHNKFISPHDSSLYVFGGYGNFTYKNLLQHYNSRSQKWDTLKTMGSIKPRYLSASGPGLHPAEILIFGGYGNASGKQEFSPEKLYDLYSLDLNTRTFKKMWELEGSDKDFVVANSLIFNRADTSFYTLCFPIHKYASYLYLRKFSAQSGQNTIIGDSIPYFFHDTKSFADLFYSEATQELVAVACYPANNGLYEVSVYTVAYPAISNHDALQASQVRKGRLNTSGIYIGLLIAGGLLAGYFIQKKRKPRHQSVIQDPISPLAVSATKDNVIKPVSPESQNAPIPDHPVPAPPRPSIFLLGGLQLFDKEGADITSSFTPALRQLLVLLILYTAKTGKGISSIRLKNTLWPDKTEESARNNRGVSIKKLRTLLHELGNATVVNESNHWVLTLDENIVCDYFFLQRVMNDKQPRTREEKLRLIKMALKGGLLTDMEHEWLDSFKSNYASKMIDVMLELAEDPNINRDSSTLISVAEVIFIQDPLNETALRIKCSELVKLGKYTVARNVYGSFVNEYALTVGTEFQISFEDLVKVVGKPE